MIIVIKYVQLVCITLFMSNSANCDQLQKKENVDLKIAACVADCLRKATHSNLEQCYDYQCSNRVESLSEVTTMAQEQLNATFQLYCRDSKRLLIQVESDDDDDHDGNQKFIYLLVIQETRISFVDFTVYISDKPLIELRDLESSQSYNISATIVSSNYESLALGTQIFTTLQDEFKPENVTKIWEQEYNEIEGDGENVDVVIGWIPARDQTCNYSIAFHGESLENDFETAEKRGDDLYYQTMRLKYGEKYEVAVRGINSFNKTTYLSRDVWYVFKTPTCMEHHSNNLTTCGPEQIKNFHAEFTFIHDNTYNVKVSWQQPKGAPEYYILELRDVYAERSDNKSKGIYNYTIDGSQTSTYIENIVIEGHECWISILAYLNGQKVESFVTVPTKGSNQSSVSIIDIIFYFAVLFIAVSLFVLFYVWQNQFVKKFTQKQFENMDLDLIKSITTHSVLQAVAELTKDATMEVERENIAVLETIGEGAFGLVKKAILAKDGGKYQVAVKMLKNSANFDDIKQFHQEISVMKSVGKHPNVVSIIGHCTSNIEELMLLTEFCDAGNLLDLLRSEFTKQLNFNDRKTSLFAPVITSQKYPDNLHNFDDDKKETSYKKLDCSSRLFVVNQMYDDLNNNRKNIIGGKEMHQRQTPLKAIEMTATNALYLELSDNDAKPFIVEVPEPENPQHFLTSTNLISFAKQVCDGMDFLSRNKVVHRDLAARNILVCSDKTAKIADFGLSRDIYQDNIYRKIGNGKLPIKWLAVESMTHQVYTSNSDVWSFGILLYEIVTLGATPYPSIGPEQLLKILNTGYRMERPRHCHHLLYDVMMSCWHANPIDRPPFEELSSKLSHFMLLESSWDGNFIDLQKLFDKCTSEMNYMKPIA